MLYASPSEPGSRRRGLRRQRQLPRRRRLADSRPCRRSSFLFVEILRSTAGRSSDRARRRASSAGSRSRGVYPPQPFARGLLAINLARRVIIPEPDVLSQRRRLVDRRVLIGGMAIGARRADMNEAIDGSAGRGQGECSSRVDATGLKVPPFTPIADLRSTVKDERQLRPPRTHKPPDRSSHRAQPRHQARRGNRSGSRGEPGREPDHPETSTVRLDDSPIDRSPR